MDMESVKEQEFLNKCSQLLEAYKRRVFGLQREQDIENYSNEFYKGLKEIASYYYPGEKLPFKYRYIARDIYLLERLQPSDSIFSYQAHDFSKVLDKPVSIKNDEVILDYLVDQTRNYLFDEVTFDRSFFPYETYDLQDKCMKATDFLLKCAYGMGIESRKIIIYPCFKRDSGVMSGNAHAFALVKINGNVYLIDCTYSQFCTAVRCNLNRIGVPFLGCSPGVFMQYDSFHKEVALTLLNRGWIECTEKVQKAYFDGFLLSYRNGLFYERTKDFSFTADYTSEDYEKFLYYEDDLFRYERKEELGYQLKPLSNPYMIIKHK